MSRLFQSGIFRLHSGAISHFKIECDSLSDVELRTLAWQVNERLRPYSRVEGVPRGGLRLAAILDAYASGNPDDPLLIVDDVYTTGESMERHRAGRVPVMGAVLFARQPIRHDWITALFTMAPLPR